jgi:hypothetical protein
MNLDQLQRTMFRALKTPLTADDDMREAAPDGTSLREVAEKIIKPNDRLTSFERLELYNRQYWWRILSALADDFPGLQALLGEERFHAMSVAYLSEHPSRSFTLRNLGSHLESWLREHLEFAGGVEQLALDLVQLEWAEIEAFDSAELPRLTEADMASLGPDPQFVLQPYVRLLRLYHPVDEWLLELKHGENDETETASNAVVEDDTDKPERAVPPLPEAKKTYLAVHRQDYSVYFKSLEPEAFALLRAIAEGKRLSEALENSVAVAGGDMDQVAARLRMWFANWSSLGWFCKQG